MTADTEVAGQEIAAVGAPASKPPENSGREIRELSRALCFELLAAHHFGRLAVVMRNGSPVIRPVNYVFDRRSQSVVFRTGRGSKFHALLLASKASFEIDGIDDETKTGWSVIIEGVTAEVTVPADIGRLRRLGLEPWAPGEKPHWVRIRAWTVSGRRIVIPPTSSPATPLGSPTAQSSRQ